MHLQTFDGVEYTFMPWTQDMMKAFQAWLVERLRTDAMDMAEIFRRKARGLMRVANAMRERGMDGAFDGLTVAQKQQAQEEWEDKAGEAQSLEFEARQMVNVIGENKTAGYYHFFGALARQSRDQFDGRVKAALLSLQVKQPTITLQEVETIARKYWLQLGNALTEANEEPKKPVAPSAGDSTQPPATTASASPSTESAAMTASATP